MLRSEQETTIVFDAESKDATVWSCDPVTLRKMKKLGVEGEELGPGVKYIIPKKWVKIRKPREISEEQREVMRETMRQRMAKNRKGANDE